MNKKNIYEKMRFESENIYYVRPCNELINDYIDIFNNPKVMIPISGKSKEYKRDNIMVWIEKSQFENIPYYSMIEKESNEYIGDISVRNVVDNIGQIAIMITPSKQGKHYSTEAIKCFCEYAHNNFGFDGFDLYVFKNNVRAIRCYEKVGFIQEGEGLTDEDMHMKKV